MKHIPERINELIQKLLDGHLLEDHEKEVLDAWYRSNIDSPVDLLVEDNEKEAENRIYKRLKTEIRSEKSTKRNTNWWKAAVILLVLVSGIVYMASDRQTNKELSPITTTAVVDSNKVTPGSNKAILTLGDGTQLALDDASVNEIEAKGGAGISELANGLIRYNTNDTDRKGPVLYNTVSTPRGGQYQIVLPDNTKVWLNASSFIRFPVEFSGSKREVELSGEAYFEVAHNPTATFIVKTNEIQVEVLGTSFDIMAYNDEELIATTLVEGSLLVTNQQSVSSLLHPGNKASYKNGKLSIEKDANVEEAVAWKNGVFYFDNTSIKNIMRQVGRWYNVDIVFEKDVDLHFSGELSRNSDIAEILRKLALTNEIQFSLNNRTIFVSHKNPAHN